MPVLLTPENFALRRAFPWAATFQRILHSAQPYRFRGSNLMLGSDFSGEHKKSRYSVYCFLVADQDVSFGWPSRRRRVRQDYLPDGRRISFKKLGDPMRQQALVPFLEAASALDGHLVGVLVHKSLRKLTTGSNTLNIWSELGDIKGKWNPKSFEDLARKTHFFSLCIAQWSPPGANITWITDEDEFVANANRLDDAQLMAAKLCSFYSPHKLGVFAMNTTAIDGQCRPLEDFVAIPDLAAGMLSEVLTKLSGTKKWSGGNGMFELDMDQLSQKSKLIADWFWYPHFRLRRTCILIDRYDKSRYSVRKFDMRWHS